MCPPRTLQSGVSYCRAGGVWTSYSHGSIASVGNRPERVNATLRVYVPAFRTRTPKMKEMVIELSGDLTAEAKRPVSKAAWLWNLGRVPSERDIIRRFMDGKLEWAALMEFLRSKYPELVKELE